MWIEVFKAGTHTDSAGIKREFKPDDLKIISDYYNAKVKESSAFEAPLVKGHPKDDDPAFGWVEKLRTNGETLFAKIKELSNELYNEVKKGMFKKISIALYPDMMLRHVGILGAVPPAVKGMQNVKFAEQKDFNEFDFERENDKEIEKTYLEIMSNYEEEINEYKEVIAELELKEHTAIIEITLDKKVEAGTMTPATKKRLSELSYELHSSLDKEKATGILNSIMKQYEKVDLELMKKLKIDKEHVKIEYNAGDDPHRINLDTEVKKVMNMNKDMTYEHALNMVMQAIKE